MPSDEWQEEYDGLVKSKRAIVLASGYEYLGRWLSRKTDRKRRLKEIFQYINDHATEVKKAQNGIVIDVGAGPGEFLEIARHYGNAVLGIDAATGEGGMGFGYLRASQLLTTRQGIPVEYTGFLDWLHEDALVMTAAASFINFRGSFEQCFAHRMHGDHRAKMDCRFLHWNEDGATRDEFLSMFCRLKRVLQPNGCILIHANGSASDDWYDVTIQSAAREAGFTLLKRESKTLHKWRIE